MFCFYPPKRAGAFRCPCVTQLCRLHEKRDGTTSRLLKIKDETIVKYLGSARHVFAQHAAAAWFGHYTF